MIGDILYPYVAFSMDCDGANGGTVFTDSKGAGFGVLGGTPITSTTWSVTGGSSLWFAGGARMITTPIPALNFGTADFEISVWLNLSANPGATPYSIFNFNTDSPATGWRLYINTNRSISFFVTGGNTVTTPASVITAGTPIHLCVTRVSGTLYIRVNGILSASGLAGAPNFYSGGMQISGALGGNWMYYGYMDRIEILAGAVRHLTDFTPETTPLIPYAAQLSGNVISDVGAPCARVIRAYDRTTGDLVGSTVSDAITGNYTINIPNFGPTFLLGLDDDAGIAYNAIVKDRLTPA